jgi:hypothetical protein
MAGYALVVILQGIHHKFKKNTEESEGVPTLSRMMRPDSALVPACGEGITLTKRWGSRTERGKP